MEFSFLEDEKFDFDLPLSPEDERNPEVEDEIFFGPVGYKERCIATNAATEATKILDNIENTRTLSPLNPEQVVEIFKEASSMAVMLKSCSSEACSDSEDQNTRKDFPELIADINKIRTKHVLDKNQNENDNQIENNGDKICEKSREGCDGFVVRKRVLKDKNAVVNEKESSQIEIKATSSEKFATPSRIMSSSRTDRSSWSSASDTSFGEEKVKKSGLKVPGFGSCPRRRSSSNSSTSSTSSLPNVNLNETFTISRASEQSKPSNIKQLKYRKAQPSAKGMLTKAITSKPMFAKPSEVPKASKLQAIKAVQTRTVSATTVKSPARLKASARPVSAGSTPRKAQTPRAEKTPGCRTTPVRRRNSNASSNSTAVKTRLNTSAPSLPEKSVTPRNGIPEVSVKGKKPVNASSVLTKRPSSVMKGTFDSMNSKLATPKPSTPENKMKKCVGDTPDKKATTPDNQIPRSTKKRRSLLPTPNLQKTQSKTSKPFSPAARNYSPNASKTIEKARKLIKKLDLNSTGCEATISKVCQEKTKDTDNKDIESIHKSPPLPQAEEAPDLMIQVSPVVPEAALVDVHADPFSPGTDSPNFTTAEVLNPIIISLDAKDLIDLSYQSPKPEVDLIDLAAKSPLVEAKLVDI